MAPVKLTDKDIDYLVRLVATEADPRLLNTRQEDYVAQVHGIVDTVLNRVAAGHWGDSVEKVANANRQFSKIAGPSSLDPYGSVDKVPDGIIPAMLPNIVTSWVTARSSGTPSSVGGNLHYANPTFSDVSNLDWINALDGPKLGYGNSTHVHGTTAGYKPVEASVQYGAPKPVTASRQLDQRRIQFDVARQNFVPLAETTGVKPLDPNMSPALQAARARLDTARQMRTGANAGVTTPEAMAITPKLKGVRGQVTGIEDRRPPLDWAEFKPGMDVGGTGSLLDDASFSPATPNPSKPPVQGLRLPTAPTPAPVAAAPPRASPRDEARMAVKAPTSPNNTAAAGRPGGATAVPAGASKTGFPTAPPVKAVPANRTPQMALTATGKQVEIGKSYPIGGSLKIAVLGADGKATFRDVTEYRDDALRKIDPNAPLVLENSLAGAAARAIAAPVVKAGLNAAGNAAKDAIGNAANAAGSKVIDLAKGANSFVADLIKPTNTLAAPTATPKPVSKSIVNPAYAEWEAKYGDGSQVQTAATGAPITKNQMAAMNALTGLSTPAPAAAAPPPPPKMITVTTAAPVPATRPNTLKPITGGGYTIQAGDTLSSIAARTGQSVNTLASLNGITDPNRIVAGNTLRLSGVATTPPASTTTTRPASSSGSSSSLAKNAVLKPTGAGTFQTSNTKQTLKVGQKVQTSTGIKTVQANGTLK